MNFLIDHDTRRAECKHEDRSVLEKYVSQNSLEMAVMIVSEPDDIVMGMTLAESSELYHSLSDRPRDFEDEEEAAELCVLALNSASTIPDYTLKLGKKLALEGQSRSSNKPDKAAPVKPTKAKADPTDNPNKRINLNGTDTVNVVDGKCKAGSILHTIVTAIDVELCGTIDEIVDYVTANHYIPKTGELADEKFAAHNIKYFLKQGKLEVDDL